jgi:hypothetical protein
MHIRIIKEKTNKQRKEALSSNPNTAQKTRTTANPKHYKVKTLKLCKSRKELDY